MSPKRRPNGPNPQPRTFRLYRTLAEHEADDRHFWKTIPPAERVIETWRLSEELWRLKGEFPDEPGLCRTITRVLRS